MLRKHPHIYPSVLHTLPIGKFMKKQTNDLIKRSQQQYHDNVESLVTDFADFCVLVVHQINKISRGL